MNSEMFTNKVPASVKATDGGGLAHRQVLHQIMYTK